MGEEEAFWMLEALLRGQSFCLHGLYSPGFPLLHRFFFQLEYLQKKHFPRLYKHLKAQDVSPMLYAPQWFITLFAYNLNMETLLRIWDIMFHEGIKIVFKLSLFLMKYVEKEVLKNDFSGIVRLLKDVTEREMIKNPDLLVSEVLKIKISRKMLDKVAKKYEKQSQGLTNQSKWRPEGKTKEKEKINEKQKSKSKK